MSFGKQFWKKTGLYPEKLENQTRIQDVVKREREKCYKDFSCKSVNFLLQYKRLIMGTGSLFWEQETVAVMKANTTIHLRRMASPVCRGGFR